MNTLVVHRAWSSAAVKMDPLREMRPMSASVALSRLEGKTNLYRKCFCVHRLWRGSSKKGKETVYPVVKITTSMFSATVPSSKTAAVSVNAFTLVFTVTAPQRMELGSSSLMIAFHFLLGHKRKSVTVVTSTRRFSK